MTKAEFLKENVHRRYNPLRGEWILVSPHRTKRPWQGKLENPLSSGSPAYDPGCYLCPGNQRAEGQINPKYKDTFVFINDFAALLPDDGHTHTEKDNLLQAEIAGGTCRVLCYSSDHSQTMAEMSVPAIRKVIEVWIQQLIELNKKYHWVQIFENKGEIMGCSNPHPHGQIWATSYLPNEITLENNCQKEYFQQNHSILLKDYLEKEISEKDRLLFENEHWITIVPFWAVWPYETMLLPKKHITRMDQLHERKKDTLAEILKIHLQMYDRLFDVSFPYTMGWHGAPEKSGQYNHWQLHAHFYPPLLRSATVKKYMVGFEMLAEAQRDITAEQAAERLRQLL